jgi:hypothetical protein
MYNFRPNKINSTITFKLIFLKGILIEGRKGTPVRVLKQYVDDAGAPIV